jgi:hypothetical protein
MRALTWHGKHDVRVETVPDLRILNPRDAIIRVTTTAICSSDLHLHHSTHPRKSHVWGICVRSCIEIAAASSTDRLRLDRYGSGRVGRHGHAQPQLLCPRVPTPEHPRCVIYFGRTSYARSFLRSRATASLSRDSGGTPHPTDSGPEPAAPVIGIY